MPQSLFIASPVEGHGFGAEVFGVPVEEQGIAALAVAGSGEAAGAQAIADCGFRIGDGRGLDGVRDGAEGGGGFVQ